MTDLTPQEHPHHSWLQRFSTTELALLVLIVSVMGAMVWYKRFYQPNIAVVPSSGSASQATVTPAPTPEEAIDAVSEENPFADVNPFADAYVNPFE